MKESLFKKSSINEMCKQVVSAPVIFRKRNGEDCLAFYNNENPILATKLYILFSDTPFPKYVEGEDLHNIKNCIIHNIDKETALSLYGKVSTLHKTSTAGFFNTLINKVYSTKDSFQECYNKKHACGRILYKGKITLAIMKDLKGNTASELIIDNNVEYNATLDKVYWAASISSKDFTAFKIKLKDINA